MNSGTRNISKVVASPQDALADIFDGARVLVGGWGGIGIPFLLIDALARSPVRGLELVSNNCGTGIEGDVGILIRGGKIGRVYTSFPAHRNARDFLAAYEAGEIEVVLVPQGTLAERMRAAGAGIGAFYTRVTADTVLESGKEIRYLNGRRYVLERPLPGDFALVRAEVADRYGNLRYRLASRAFNPVMAMAGRVTVAEVEQLVEELDPDDVHTPGIFVDRVVVVGR